MITTNMVVVLMPDVLSHVENHIGLNNTPLQRGHKNSMLEYCYTNKRKRLFKILKNMSKEGNV